MVKFRIYLCLGASYAGCVIPLLFCPSGPIKTLAAALIGATIPPAIVLLWSSARWLVRSFSLSWLQFRLRTLLIVMASVCGCLVLIEPDLERRLEHARLIAAVEALGGDVMLRETGEWLSVTEVFAISFSRVPIGDAELQYLASFPATNAVQSLNLMETKVTDAGMKSAATFTAVTQLLLAGLPITDEGLAELHGLRNLQELWVYNTKVTPAAVEKLEQAIPEVKVGAHYWYLSENTGAEDAAENAADASVAPGVPTAYLLLPAGRMLISSEPPM